MLATDLAQKGALNAVREQAKARGESKENCWWGVQPKLAIPPIATPLSPVPWPRGFGGDCTQFRQGGALDFLKIDEKIVVGRR